MVKVWVVSEVVEDPRSEVGSTADGLLGVFMSRAKAEACVLNEQARIFDRTVGLDPAEQHKAFGCWWVINEREAV